MKMLVTFFIGISSSLVLASEPNGPNKSPESVKHQTSNTSNQTQSINNNQVYNNQNNNKQNNNPSLVTVLCQGPAKDSDPKIKAECEEYQAVAEKLKRKFQPISDQKSSSDRLITCKMNEPFIADYDACAKAVNYYNAVLIADVVMEEQQKIRTELNNRKLQQDASRSAAFGDSQTGVLDAAQKSNEHMKQMEAEKIAAYGLAVGALVSAHKLIPDEKKLQEMCSGDAKCAKAVKATPSTFLRNQDAKDALKVAIIKFMTKATMAGIKMGQYGNSAQQISQARQSIAPEEGQDLMMDRCAFNPTDPACIQSGNRVSGRSYRSGEFGINGDSGNNSFDLTPSSEESVEAGAETNLEDRAQIAGVNSPFVDEAKVAKDILEPAGAAQTQASGGAGGGGGGGVGGGLGGGSASLGSDLQGSDEDNNKEAQIKTNSVSGNYSGASGGGFKGISQDKENSNPFSSLFDSKSNGGVEEDRSIASGDIDGKASGLFQKISKRYGLIQADKRIEAKNLE